MRIRIWKELLVAVTISLAAIATSVKAHEYKAGDLVIHHPWSRATPGGAKVGGGYFKVDNKGGEADRVTGATAEGAAEVQIHTMEMKDGVMVMRPVEGGVEIPAGGEVEFKPGGYHLMLMGLEKPLVEGERVKGTLEFEKAGTVEVEFAVEAMGKPSMDMGGDHSGHNMGKSGAQ